MLYKSDNYNNKQASSIPISWLWDHFANCNGYNGKSNGFRSVTYSFYSHVICWTKCQYQCNRLPGRTRLWHDLLCVERDIKIY